MVGGSTSSRNAISVAATPAAPQAPCGWPIIDLIAEPASLFACLPKASFTARVSMRSLRSVDVPW
jgi:hypothetical protein